MDDNIIPFNKKEKKKSKASTETELMMLGCPDCSNTLFYIFHDEELDSHIIACQHCDLLVAQLDL